MSRLGAAAVILFTGCAQPAAPVVPQPVVVDHVVASTVPSPPPSPPARRASRSRRSLPTLLLRIRSCESGPNGYATHGWAMDADYQLTNPHSSASGAYQVIIGTWGRFRGYRRAMDAPPAVQDAFALQLFGTAGTVPWNESAPCWSA